VFRILHAIVPVRAFSTSSAMLGTDPRLKLPFNWITFWELVTLSLKKRAILSHLKRTLITNGNNK